MSPRCCHTAKDRPEGKAGPSGTRRKSFGWGDGRRRDPVCNGVPGITATPRRCFRRAPFATPAARARSIAAALAADAARKGNAVSRMPGRQSSTRPDMAEARPTCGYSNPSHRVAGTDFASSSLYPADRSVAIIRGGGEAGSSHRCHLSMHAICDTVPSARRAGIDAGTNSRPERFASSASVLWPTCEEKFCCRLPGAGLSTVAFAVVRAAWRRCRNCRRDFGQGLKRYKR